MCIATFECTPECTCILGILAGMRPCGVIVLVGELFISESKTQVYGYLHQFLAMHPSVAKMIGKYVLYKFGSPQK